MSVDKLSEQARALVEQVLADAEADLGRPLEPAEAESIVEEALGGFDDLGEDHPDAQGTLG